MFLLAFDQDGKPIVINMDHVINLNHVDGEVDERGESVPMTLLVLTNNKAYTVRGTLEDIWQKTRDGNKYLWNYV